MPFTGPEGQGPYESIDGCVADIEDNDDIDDPEGLCAFWKELDENQANAMTEPTDEPEYRAYHQGQPRLREVDDESEEGMMTIRMPIASTGEVRNEGDDPLTRDEIDGMARQINERDVGVFLAHGDSTELTAARYGQTERLGNWRDANVLGADEREESDGTDLLMADAVMPDPETLPNGVGRFREVLGILKEQAKRGIGMSASIGWREDEDAPGGNDLMEASIVGIPADPRTMTQDGPAVAVARAAVEAGADPEALVEAVRAAVETQSDSPAHEGGSPQDAVTGDEDPAADTEHDMTDNEDTEPDAENEAEGTDDESTERQEAPEWASDLRELLESMNETLGDVAEAVRQDDDDDEDEEDDDEEDNETDEDEDDDEENTANADVTADQREALDTLRDGGFNVDDLDLPEPDDEQDADADSDGSEPEPDTRDTDTDDEHPLDKYAFPQ